MFRQGLPKEPRRSLACTDVIESIMGSVGRVRRNVERWRDASMALRWTAPAILEAVEGFRRLKAKSRLPQLRAALVAHQQRADPAASFARARQAGRCPATAPRQPFSTPGGTCPERSDLPECAAMPMAGQHNHRFKEPGAVHRRPCHPAIAPPVPRPTAARVDREHTTCRTQDELRAVLGTEPSTAHLVEIILRKIQRRSCRIGLISFTGPGRANSRARHRR